MTTARPTSEITGRKLSADVASGTLLQPSLIATSLQTLTGPVRRVEHLVVDIGTRYRAVLHSDM